MRGEAGMGGGLAWSCLAIDENRNVHRPVLSEGPQGTCADKEPTSLTPTDQRRRNWCFPLLSYTLSKTVTDDFQNS